MKIIIAGSSGFIGSYLKALLETKGHQVTPLVRQKEKKGIYWNPETKKIDPSALENVDVVLNLCGSSILGRWTKKKMENIRDSRWIPTHFLCQTLLQLQNPPKIYIGASAIGYYGDIRTDKLTEESTYGEGFVSEVCRGWEAFATPLKEQNIRIVLARFGMVLDKKRGVFQKMLFPFKLGFGGVIGTGNQYVSWISLKDLGRAFMFSLENEQIEGAINFVAPYPLTNHEMTSLLAKWFQKPTFFRVPESLLFLLFGKGASVFLSDLKVYPKKLLDHGFEFVTNSFENFLRIAK